MHDLQSRCGVIVLSVLLSPITGFADGSFSFNGHYKSFFVIFCLPKYGTPAMLVNQPLIGAVDNRLRLKLFYSFNARFTAEVAYELAPRVQDPLLFENQPTLVGLDPYRYRAFDFHARLYPAQGRKAGSFGIFHNLDRAMVTVKTAPADIIIGRQAIAWGSARVLNPTDVLAPFAFEALDTEERTGVDAVRLTVPLSALAEFDAGYVFGKNFRFAESAVFARAKFYTMKTDVAMLLLAFRENLMVGIDVARSLGNAGFWLEAAYVFADVFKETGYQEANNYLRATIGVDYALSGSTYGFIEYHYNEGGAGEPKNYLRNLSHPAYTDGTVYLLARHYLAPGLTHQLTPLISFSGQALLNVSDGSMFMSSAIEYNVAQDIYLSAGAFFRIGRQPEIVTNGTLSPVPQFNSEFGGYPNIYFSSFRIYF